MEDESKIRIATFFIISKDKRNQEQKVKSQDVFNFTDFDFLFFRFTGGKLSTSQ